MTDEELLELLERIRYEPARAIKARDQIRAAFAMQQEYVYKLEKELAYHNRPKREDFSPMDIWV